MGFDRSWRVLASQRILACFGGTRRVSVVFGVFRWVSEGLGISEGLGGTRWVSPGEGISKDLSWVKTGLNGFW